MAAFRFALGGWLDANRNIGFEATFFSIDQRTNNFSASSDAGGSPMLAFPFINQTPGNVGPALMPITTPGAFNGDINIGSSLSLWGTELNGVFCLLRTTGGFEFTVLAGFRYLDLIEHLNIQTDSQSLADNTLTSFFDNLSTRNQFYGGQLGTRVTWQSDRLAFDITGKVALGVTCETVDVQGTTVQFPGNSFTPNVYPGGLFAQQSNMGRSTASQFGLVPSVELKLSYAMTPRCRLFVGYDFMYWNQVVRPGSQIDRNINLTQSAVLNNGTPALTDFDRQVFARVVPEGHYLCRVDKPRGRFRTRFRARLAEAYSPGMGRPAIDPVRMLKILFLRFHYKLSDRQVMERITTDVAFRWFLAFPVGWQVPNHTGGTYFRKRIGAERFAQVFQELISQAREAGLVKDRLRLKDATHLFADVADVQPLQLAAQVRERLLQAATPFFPDWVDEQRKQIETLRQTTAEFADDERLAARLEHLREMATQLHERCPQWPRTPATEDRVASAAQALDLVAKLLADRAPGAQDRLVSAMDPEARVGKHGGYFVGYLLDMTIDPDSELITNVNVLPGNGAEAADAITLIRQEEAAQGNDVAALSMDGSGYNGPVLRELSDPQGLNLDVTVPPPAPAARTTFGPERFSLTIIDAQARRSDVPERPNHSTAAAAPAKTQVTAISSRRRSVSLVRYGRSAWRIPTASGDASSSKTTTKRNTGKSRKRPARRSTRKRDGRTPRSNANWAKSCGITGHGERAFVDWPKC